MNGCHAGHERHRADVGQSPTAWPSRSSSRCPSWQCWPRGPCCGGLHTLLDIMLDLRAKQGLQAADVAQIECHLHPQKVAYLDRPAPTENLAAKFSTQYCVAVALLVAMVRASTSPLGTIM